MPEESQCSLRKVDTVQVFLEQMSHLYSGVESEVYFRSDYSLSPFCLLKYFCPSLLSFINFPSYSRTCPVPCTINLVEVKACKPIGPLACSFCVLIPISAP